MPLIHVANRIDFKTDEILSVVVNEHKIILINTSEVKAYLDECPHEGGPLSQGVVDNGEIVCPFHQWRFSIDTGKHISSKKCLTEFKVVEKSDEIFLDIKESVATDHTQNSNEKFKSISSLPSPKGHLLLGHLREFMAENKQEYFEQWAKECGDLFKIKLLNNTFLVSCNQELNNLILKDRPNKFRRNSKISRSIESFGVLGAFNSEGDIWKKHRKLISHSLNAKNVSYYIPLLVDTTLKFLSRWEKASLKQESIDFQQEMLRYTEELTLCNTLAFEVQGDDSEKTELQSHLDDIFHAIYNRASFPLPYWKYVKTTKQRNLSKSQKRAKEIIIDKIKKAKEKLTSINLNEYEPRNFLEVMLLYNKESDYSEEEMFSNIFLILLAGEPTTANSMAWVIYYLSQLPNVVDKVRREVNQYYSDFSCPNSYINFGKLKYTEAVALESMRLKPVVPNIFLEAIEDVRINGIHIEKGQGVILQNKVSQLSESNFFNPNSFIPERWMKNDKGEQFTHNSSSYRVFGSGPRFCPGKNLAMHEMIMIIATLCKNFNLKQNPDYNVVEGFDITHIPKNISIRLDKV